MTIFDTFISGDRFSFFHLPSSLDPKQLKFPETSCFSSINRIRGGKAYPTIHVKTAVLAEGLCLKSMSLYHPEGIQSRQLM